MQSTLDLLSQVLFVALMAMLLFVLYRRFQAMLLRGRITGDYARVVSCQATEAGAEVTLEAPAPGPCTVRWEGGQAEEWMLVKGMQSKTLAFDGVRPDALDFDFGNQTVRRRIEP